MRRSPTRSDAALAARLVVFCAGWALLVPATTNVGPVTGLPAWWVTPIAIQKLVVWVVLWQVALVANALRKSARPLDAALFGAVMLVGIGLLRAGTTHGAPFDTLPHAGVWALLGCVALLGSRQREALRPARPEVCAALLLVLAFDAGNLVFGLKIVLAVAWCAPTLTAMRRPASPGGYVWAVAGCALALLLLFARGGALSWAAVGLALAVQAGAALARRAPEAGAFSAFATVCLFGHYAGVGAGTLTSTTFALLLGLASAAVLAGPVLRAVPRRQPRGASVAARRPKPGRLPAPAVQAVRPRPYRPSPHPRPRPAPGIRVAA